MILKPPKGAMVNRGHPYARGLVGCWLMNEGGGDVVADLSGNGNTGTITGLTWQAGKFGSALNSDGTSNYIDCGLMPQAKGVGALSVSAWVKVPGASIPSTMYIASIKGDTGSRTFELQTGESENVNFIVYNSSDTEAAGVWTDGFVGVANIWLHIVGVYDGANVYVYRNGVIGGTVGNLTGVTDSSATKMAVGAENIYGQNDWIGSIDNVSIYNRALSLAEILHLYRSPFCMFEVDL